MVNGKTFDERGEKLLKEWVGRAGDGRVVFAIGNGKASVETQMAVSAMIRFGKFGAHVVRFCTVPENGASKYSITKLAEEDLPNMPPTQRSAVSIGRRLIDPLGEYVKIEPKHLGLGMYQHSVNAKKLSEALELVVRECVSMRGVDVNVASAQLLAKVCGLNKKTAAGLVALRERLGRIHSREEIKDVKGLGAKSFEQCAGTLLSRVGLTPSDLPCQNLSVKLQSLTNLTDEEKAVRELFCTEIKTLPPPELMVRFIALCLDLMHTLSF
ncbi:hypothetical protein OESDEN_05473 [Oesophagostomum dentatum]|uniref:Tex protein YqgF-like domain-containing protein n=1 Tax=Oesophagostomum dentatum TaxID=61180 RepID=A0A0B1TFK1_OESDE|nr:hypothetical protein OESDEN_05473 [Oesophagostomum dentatum]